MTDPAQMAETGTAGHTPGPWKVVTVGGTSTNISRADGKEAYAIAHVISTIPRARKGEVGANANLIAAAPELYAALNECRLWLEDNQPMPTARMWELAAKVRAALAKATGG